MAKNNGLLAIAVLGIGYLAYKQWKRGKSGTQLPTVTEIVAAQGPGVAISPLPISLPLPTPTRVVTPLPVNTVLPSPGGSSRPVSNSTTGRYML